MKTIQAITIAIVSITVITFFTACDSTDEGDTQKPVIQLNAPVEGDVLKIGADIHLDMDLSDNDELRSCKINIHSAEGHSHNTKASSVDIFNKSWDVSGQKNVHIHHHEIIIPEDTPEGDYHFMVYCTDASGNESHVVRTIELSHNGHGGEHD